MTEIAKIAAFSSKAGSPVAIIFHSVPGQGMTKHLSNTCYDNFADEDVCPRLARTNCHGFAKNCRKVRSFTMGDPQIRTMI